MEHLEGGAGALHILKLSHLACKLLPSFLQPLCLFLLLCPVASLRKRIQLPPSALRRSRGVSGNWGVRGTWRSAIIHAATVVHGFLSGPYSCRVAR